MLRGVKVWVGVLCAGVLLLAGCQSGGQGGAATASSTDAAQVKQQIAKGVVLLCLEKKGCKSCEQMEPITEAAAKETGIRLVKVFPDNNLMGTFEVSSFPTMVLYNNGVECDRWIGYRSQSEVVDMINRCKAKTLQ